MIERAELGGTCLNWGCIPTKALLATADLLRRVRHADEFGLVVPEVSFDFPKMMARKEDIVLKMREGVEGAAKRKGVNVVRGEGRVDGDAVVVGDERFPYDHLVVCVGTEPSGLPGYDMDHPAVLTSNEILRLEAVPESMIVVGGGRHRLRVRQPVRRARHADHDRRDPAPPPGRHRRAHRHPVPEAAREGRRDGPPRPPGRGHASTATTASR